MALASNSDLESPGILPGKLPIKGGAMVIFFLTNG